MRLILVAVIADGIGEARDVEPRNCHPFAVVWRGEQAIHLFLPGVRAFVVQKGVHFFDRWREPDQIQTETTQQGAFVSFRGGSFPVFLQVVARRTRRSDW